MKIVIIHVGRTTEKYLAEGQSAYLRRINHYVSSEEIIVPAGMKSLDAEGKAVLKKILPADKVIALDESGIMMRSVELADQVGKWMNAGASRIVFVTGGAYGLSEEVKRRASLQLSFSKFTFTHQMIRLILAEQIYRAMTILRNEKYHHE